MHKSVFYVIIRTQHERRKTNFKRILKKLNFFKKSVDIPTNKWYINKRLNERDFKKREIVLWKLSKTSIWVAGLKTNLNKVKYNFFWRVWSWLRMNAGGMPKTCKSNEEAQWRWSACTKLDLDSLLVADGWVTRGWPTFKLGITIGNDC